VEENSNYLRAIHDNSTDGVYLTSITVYIVYMVSVTPLHVCSTPGLQFSATCLFHVRRGTDMWRRIQVLAWNRHVEENSSSGVEQTCRGEFKSWRGTDMWRRIQVLAWTSILRHMSVLRRDFNSVLHTCSTPGLEFSSTCLFHART
jgi:hypothetical protein